MAHSSLGATVAIAAIVHAALALRSLAPWIVPDEPMYSEIAKSIGDGGLPKVRGEVTVEWGLTTRRSSPQSGGDFLQ